MTNMSLSIVTELPGLAKKLIHLSRRKTATKLSKKNDLKKGAVWKDTPCLDYDPQTGKLRLQNF